MTRIAALNPESTTGTTKKLLDAVNKGLGVTPNLFRVAAQSAAGLEGMVALHGAISGGTFSAKMREAIALATAEADGCDYCLSAHSYLGKRAGLSDADVDLARDGGGSDLKIAAATKLARVLIERRGHATDADVAAAHQAGFTDGELVELIANVAWSVFTNYVNVVAGTEIDFEPVVRHRERRG